MAYSYQLRYVRCGKPGCGPCAGGVGHGPYWYGYERRGARVHSKYFGRLPPDAVFAKQAKAPPVDPRWKYNGRMDLKTAMRILGFIVLPSPKLCQLRWRDLVGTHHPDRGGETAVCAAINAAYDYLKKYVR